MPTVFANLVRWLKMSTKKHEPAFQGSNPAFWDLPSHSFYTALLSTANEEIFLSSAHDSYLSFFKHGSLAVVPPQQGDKLNAYLLLAFEKECLRLGLHSLYIGVGRPDLAFFNTINKQYRLIGYEGFANIQLSELDWANDALLLANDRNLSVHVYESPLLDGLVQQLEAVAIDRNITRQPIGYAASVTSRRALTRKLKFCSVAVLENSEGKVFAFSKLNASSGNGTGSFGTISQTFDAPANAQRLLIAGIIRHFRRQGRRQISLGSVSATSSKLSSEKNLNQYVHEWHPHYAVFSKSLNPNQVLYDLAWL
ncbi:hypothetical protein DYU11_00230 [Fibrisoma montanum]|uniref:Uncharacterized protein n=1 Tax=Fibrisoma montanum TaxID=2305895 RepID=A0A418MH78_9BACT|nr:hypothetical protein [Fibrisoma montanum]RIV26786.1 hypothetical protein DYU11_00230 [Fibrisoma montanum]